MKKKFKIAAVDDNDDLLFTLKYGIGKVDKSLEVITFNDSIQFITDANKNKYDLILLDIMMPKQNGWDTFAEIKKSKFNNKTKIIFLTAKTDKQSQILGVGAADDFIVKPFDINALVDKIKKHLK